MIWDIFKSKSSQASLLDEPPKFNVRRRGQINLWIIDTDKELTTIPNRHASQAQYQLDAWWSSSIVKATTPVRASNRTFHGQGDGQSTLMSKGSLHCSSIDQ
jgi:hypothetical protein